MMQTFPVQGWYRVTAVLCLMLGLLFGWRLLQGFEPGMLVFLLLSVSVAGWQWRAARTEIALGSDRLLVNAPLTPNHEIEFRQLLDVVEEGRMGRSILVMYHPLAENGLLALDDVRTLALPSVVEQEKLFDTLKAQAPE
jgi:hypothetical protein